MITLSVVALIAASLAIGAFGGFMAGCLTVWQIETRALFARLEQIGNEIRDGAPSGTLQAVWQGTQHVTEPGVQALEFMVTKSGLSPFNRASKAQRGGARAIGTKYQWYFLTEYLGWQWERT